MPEKSWEKWLSEKCWMFVERMTECGRVTRFRIILLAEIAGTVHCVTRYDTAHGFPHRDVLAFGGQPISKEIMQETDLNLAFDTAYADLQRNYEIYLRAYKKQ